MKKIPTLFKRVFSGHKIIDVLPEVNPDLREAFLHGVATVKFDGSCCAIINGNLYRRWDTKGKKIPPAGAIQCAEYPDETTGSFPFFVPCDRDNPADKWFFEAYNHYWAAHKIREGTYEAIGKHFNGNPYNMDYDTLVKHGETCVLIERDFESIRSWLWKHNEEGLVFWLKGQPVCKIKRTDFNMPWPVKGEK